MPDVDFELTDRESVERERARLARGKRRVATGWATSDASRPIEPTTVFSPEELQRARERLTAGDGLHHLLARIGGSEASDSTLPLPLEIAAPGFFRRHRASVVTVILYFTLVVIPGVVISMFGDRVVPEPFVKITDWREFPGALFLYLVLAPVIWTLYLWQPRLIVEVFAGLANSGAIGPALRDGVAPDVVLRRTGASFVQPALPRGRVQLRKGALLSMLCVGLSIAALAVWPPTAPPPLDPLVPDSEVFWWRVIPPYFWAVWLPLVFVNVYMLAWIVIRQTVMIGNIQRLLRHFSVEPIPFHPDGCSGFAPIGNYAINMVRVALIVGAWVLVLLASGPISGHGLYVAPYTMFLVVVQLLLTPYLLLGPVWDARRVMSRAREAALQQVGDDIRRSLGSNGGSRLQEGPADHYQELEARYHMVEEGYHRWPFGRTAISRVSITAGVTLAANVAAILYRIWVG